MIRMVSIVHSVSGITLFTKVFNDFCEEVDGEISMELIGSFLTAIKLFSKQFGQDEIKQIEMSTLKFLITEKEGIMVFFLTEHDDKTEEYKRLLTMCCKTFKETYFKNANGCINDIDRLKGFNEIR